LSAGKWKKGGRNRKVRTRANRGNEKKWEKPGAGGSSTRSQGSAEKGSRGGRIPSKKKGNLGKTGNHADRNHFAVVSGALLHSYETMLVRKGSRNKKIGSNKGR